MWREKVTFEVRDLLLIVIDRNSTQGDHVHNLHVSASDNEVLGQCGTVGSTVKAIKIKLRFRA